MIDMMVERMENDVEVDQGVLDDLVTKCHTQMASNLNNKGPKEQLRWLIMKYDLPWTVVAEYLDMEMGKTEDLIEQIDEKLKKETV